MKKLLFLIIVAYALNLNVYSQPPPATPKKTISVVSTAGKSTLFLNPDSAVNFAKVGDFIYLSGGVYSFSNPISKGVNIIGAGHYPDSTLATGFTTINTDIIIAKGAHNLYLEGLFITGNISFKTLERSDNVVIKRCNVNNITFNGGHFAQFAADSTHCNNVKIIHNVIRGSMDFGGAQNPTVSGNIINGGFSYVTHGAMFENNIMLYSGNGHIMEDMRDATFKNNIFKAAYDLTYPGYACYNGPCGSWNNTLLNNIFTSDSATVKIYNGMSVTVQKCKYGVNLNSLFVKQSGSAFNYNDDYHIKTSSPAYNAGTDGKNPGIYGSDNPYKEGAVPINPHISFKKVAPNSSSDSKLNINIKVKAQSN